MSILEETFLLILNMSITATYVALAIMAFRFILLRKLPRAFSYSMWGILLFRLLSPVSFSLNISFVNLFGRGVRHIAETMEYVPARGLETIRPPAPGAGNESIWNTAEVPLSEVLEITPGAAMTAGLSLAETITAIAAVIWITGIAALIVYGVFTYIKVTSRVKTATLLNDGIVAEAMNRTGLRRRVKVYLSDRIESPFVCGFFLPRIYIPPVSLNKDLSFILIHEMTHVKRFDYLVKPFACLVLTLHWFNPVIWLSFKFMGRDMEMSCDEKVMKVLGDQTRQDYSYTLLAMATVKNRLLPGSPLAFGESNVKSRIKNILKFKKPAFFLVVIAALLMAAAGCVLLANPHSLDMDVTFTPRSIEIDIAGEMRIIDFNDEDSGQIARLLQYDTWEKAKMSYELSTMTYISDGAGKVIGLYEDVDGYTFILLFEGFGQENRVFYRAPGEVYGNVKQYLLDNPIQGPEQHDPTYESYDPYRAINEYIEDIGYSVADNSVAGVWIKLPDSFDDGSDIGPLLKARNELSKSNGFDFSSFLGELVLVYTCSSDADDDLILLLSEGAIIDEWEDVEQSVITVYELEIIGAWKDASQSDFQLLRSALAGLFSDYKLQDIKEAYFYDIYDDRIIYVLTAEEIAALVTAFNDALETIQKPEPGWPEAYSPGMSLTFIVSDQKKVILYEFGGSDLFLVDYVGLLENGRSNRDSYKLESAKLREVYVTLRSNVNRSYGG